MAYPGFTPKIKKNTNKKPDEICNFVSSIIPMFISRFLQIDLSYARCQH